MQGATEETDARVLDLPCRYNRVYTDPDVPCDEDHFHFVERRMPVPVAQAALVLVDIWATHYIDSWLRRASEVTRTRIVPLLQTARELGMTIVHAPSPYVVERHYRDSMPPPTPRPLAGAVEWPPTGFRSIYRGGEHTPFGRAGNPGYRPPTSATRPS